MYVCKAGYMEFENRKYICVVYVWIHFLIWPLFCTLLSIDRTFLFFFLFPDKLQKAQLEESLTAAGTLTPNN